MRASVSSERGCNLPGIPNKAAAPQSIRSSAPDTNSQRYRWVAGTSKSTKRGNTVPAEARSVRTGVFNRDWRAGNNVKQPTQAMTKPQAVQTPISRTGRISETASAAKPTAVANMEAVLGRNLLVSARAWCSSRVGASSGSMNRE